MPRDVQIVRSASETAPKDYLIPKDAEVILRAVKATFTDNGAGADWLPCVTLISDSGHTIAQACDQNVKVTAGDDAEVSWFPGVKPGSAASGGVSTAYARGSSDFVDGDPAQTITAHGSQRGQHAHVTTTDASIMSWRTTFVQNDTLDLKAAGTYILWSNAFWSGANTNLTSTIMSSGVAGFRHNPWLPDGTAPFVPTDGLANSLDYDVYNLDVGDTVAYVLNQNNTGVDSDVNAQFLTVAYLATGVAP